MTWNECTILGERFRFRVEKRRAGGDRLIRLEHPTWRQLSARGWGMDEAVRDLHKVGQMYFRIHVGTWPNISPRMPPEGKAYRDFLIKLVLGDERRH